jgi:hypothetical protein
VDLAHASTLGSDSSNYWKCTGLNISPSASPRSCSGGRSFAAEPCGVNIGWLFLTTIHTSVLGLLLTLSARLVPDSWPDRRTRAQRVPGSADCRLHHGSAHELHLYCRGALLRLGLGALGGQKQWHRIWPRVGVGRRNLLAAVGRDRLSPAAYRIQLGPEPSFDHLKLQLIAKAGRCQAKAGHLVPCSSSDSRIAICCNAVPRRAQGTPDARRRLARLAAVGRNTCVQPAAKLPLAHGWLATTWRQEFSGAASALRIIAEW